MTTVRFKKTHSAARLPFYASAGAAGADVYTVDDYVLSPGEWRLFPTGLQVEIPEGFEIQVRPRSGLAFKNGISVLNAPGTIDSDYRGELMVMLINHGAEPLSFSVGDRIAQIVVAPVVQATFEFTDEVSETDRGAGGFGSTGRK